MIMPAKHIKFSESFLGFGSYLLKKIDKKISVDELWSLYHIDLKNNVYHVHHSFDNFLLTLVFLYSVDSIYEVDGRIIKNETN